MEINFEKMNGLIPAVVQHYLSGQVLMLGYMNAEAVAKTQSSGKVWFYSRSKERLWKKGETSGNVLKMVSMQVDCDGDALLIQAMPKGPTCHTGSTSCFADSKPLLLELEQTIQQRINAGNEQSYVKKLYRRGPDKVAQKVGEEAVEMVIEAMREKTTGDFVQEAADLMFHYLMLLQMKGSSLDAVAKVLKSRKK